MQKEIIKKLYLFQMNCWILDRLVGSQMRSYYLMIIGKRWRSGRMGYRTV